ncbi:MAG: C1 family peptidase [Rhizomicrobium sp.]
MRILALLGIVVCVTGGLIAASAPAKIPASINWVERGVVPPVRDQGACGGDYAYVTASSVGSLQAIHKKGKVFVSEQQLLDCASAYGGQGCRGGQLETGFQYIIANGATTRESYPVTGDSGECKVNGGAIKIKAYKNLPAGDCKALESAVARQPVMAVVDGMSLYHYSGGVFSSDDPSPKHDHAVLVVGYTKDYWIVQNSWGESWGEQGYIRLKRGNTAGICDMASYPIL